VADTTGQNRKFCALDVGGKELCVFGRRSDGVGRAGDNLNGNRNLLQARGCERAGDGGSNGKNGPDARITIGIAGTLQRLLHLGLLLDRLELLH